MFPMGSRRMLQGFVVSMASIVQGGDKTVGMFCHEFCRWEREVEIGMCDKCVGELANKGVNN